MNEVFDPAVESSRKAIVAFGIQAKERLSAQLKREPTKTLSIILGGSILFSVVVGYCISRKEEESRRQRFVESWMREVKNWIRQNGWKIATPIQGGLEATKSVAEDASKSTARHWLPFFEKQKRSILNLF